MPAARAASRARRRAKRSARYVPAAPVPSLGSLPAPGSSPALRAHGFGAMVQLPWRTRASRAMEIQRASTTGCGGCGPAPAVISTSFCMISGGASSHPSGSHVGPGGFACNEASASARSVASLSPRAIAALCTSRPSPTVLPLAMLLTAAAAAAAAVAMGAICWSEAVPPTGQRDLRRAARTGQACGCRARAGISAAAPAQGGHHVVHRVAAAAAAAAKAEAGRAPGTPVRRGTMQPAWRPTV
mmetsp:Transcript_55251/g.177095  ORF Transcript_55251/g.177095 Transcript_55251/m.177095 type:complete len:243 (-) Transcript_55251:26-754(-)